MKKRILIYLLLGITAFVAMSSPLVFGATREPAVAGAFYPADSVELANLVKGHLDNIENPTKIDGQLLALIVPHAGLIYSGQVATYGYKLLENSGIDKVILCGPSHRYNFSGLSVYGPFIDWKTPLGSIKCNNSICDKLISFDKDIEVVRQAHQQEHSLEVQLPYLQTVLGNFELIPISMGEQDKSTNHLLSKALEIIDTEKNTIMIASSDWQHFRSASEGWKLDSLGLACIENMEIDKLELLLESRQVEMCGGGPAIGVIRAAISKGANKVKLLKYGDSGDITGDKSNVVGYAAIAIYKSEDKLIKTEKIKKTKSKVKQATKELPKQFKLTQPEKEELLQIARKSIEDYLVDSYSIDFDVSDNLKKFGAAFVTLEKDGQLRGCIGNTSAVEELYKTVSSCAVKAAMFDPRFPPLEPAEINQIHIEISVMSPMQLVDSFDEIVIGRDGLMIFKGKNRGLLLPQVATDYGWNRTEFLEQICRKAGLYKNAYLDDDAVIYKFQAVIFGE
ncbi:MAG: AmmeMemoRadiSam system protein B [candidate division Zixibacteria bacterium]|nr:AmmeMemoRadiSam system protein B [candidate division Zixibacteria bacterium]